MNELQMNPRESDFFKPFGGYFRPSGEEKRAALGTALVVVDTNVLLNLYRYTSEARRQLVEMLERLGERLWIPHHVAYEFHRRRIDVIDEQMHIYEETARDLDEATQRAINALRRFANQCGLPVEEKERLTSGLSEERSKIRSEIERYRQNYDLSVAESLTTDPVVEILARLFHGKMGKPISDNERERLVREFGERVEKGIPPGFKDAKKADNAEGDFLIYRAMAEEAISRSLNLVFVTDDKKKDWVREEQGFAIGPRLELIEELREKGVGFQLFTVSAFLIEAGRAFEVPAGTQAVEESKRLSLFEELDQIRAEHAQFTEEVSNLEDHRVLLARSRVEADRHLAEASDLRVDLMNRMAMSRVKGALDEYELLADQLKRVEQDEAARAARAAQLNHEVHEVSIRLDIARSTLISLEHRVSIINATLARGDAS